MGEAVHQRLSWPTYMLIGLAASAGLWLMAWSVASATWTWSLVLILIFVLCADLFRVDMLQHQANHKISITLDIVAAFFVLRLFGLPWAMMALFINTLFFGLTRRAPAYKVIYNIGTLIIAIWIANFVIHYTAASWLIAVPMGATAYFLLNTISIALILTTISRQSILRIWLENYAWMSLQHISLAVSGYALGQLVASAGWSALVVALPLPMLHYTYQLYTKANHRHTKELEDLSTELIMTLAAVVDARDALTFGHSEQVARYSRAIARRLGHSEQELTQLYRSALLHDIGKVGIPEYILLKPSRLTSDEYEIMKKHAAIGYDIINQIHALKPAAIVARDHHERWNGNGYPHGLAGNKIGLDSRIVGVADTLETLLSDRPYRQGCSLHEALAEIDRCTGTQFDPVVVKALHAVVHEEGETFFVNSARLIRKAGARIVLRYPFDKEGTHHEEASPARLAACMDQ